MNLRLCIFFAIVFSASMVNGQILTPVKWSYAAKRLDQKNAVLFLKAEMESGWHIYSTKMQGDGPITTVFTFIATPDYALLEDVIEPKPIKYFEKSFERNALYFEKSVIFQQKILLKKDAMVIKGKLRYMACDNKRCLPPQEVSFEIPVK